MNHRLGEGIILMGAALLVAMNGDTLATIGVGNAKLALALSLGLYVVGAIRFWKGCCE